MGTKVNIPTDIHAVTVRDAGEDDRQFFIEHMADTLTIRHKVDSERATEHAKKVFERYLHANNSPAEDARVEQYLLIAEQPDGPIGYAYLTHQPSESTFTIRSISSNIPKFTTRLIHAAEEHAIRCGATKLYSYVAPVSRNIIVKMEANGFTKTGITETFSELRLAMYLMMKNLP